MRIGIVAPPWVPVPPPRYGGTESVIDRLARGLAQAGHDVLLAAAANSTCPVPHVAGTKEAEEDAPLCSDTNTELCHIVKSYKAMTDVEVIHDHTLAGPMFHRWGRSTPVVTTLHGPFDPTLTPIYGAFRDVSVVAISQHQAKAAVGVSIARVIHHGIDVAAVPEGKGDGGYASFLGRMNPEKAPREAALIARAAGVPLRMAAKLREPAEKEYFDAEVKPLLGSDIEYVGELGEEEKLALVGGSFALLNPVQWPEPFGLVMIEALATGTPVVATPFGSVPELIDDGVTGYVRQGEGDLAAALLKAASLDRAECRAVARRRFDIAGMVHKHIELYTELVSSGPSRNRGVRETARVPWLRIGRPQVSSHRPASVQRPGAQASQN